MSAIVSSIITNAKSIISTACGAGYQELAHVYAPEKNNIRQAKLAYGIRAGQVDSASSVIKGYTVDQTFEILLTDALARNADGDSQLQSSIGTMYDKADEIFRSMVATKMNMSSYVLLVFNPTILEPQVVKGDTTFVLLTLQIRVKYRNDITS